MIKELVRIIYFVVILFSSITSRNQVQLKDQVLEMILLQYPMYVKISENGEKILLKKRDKQSFDLLVSNLQDTQPIRIDSSHSTQLSLTWHPGGHEIYFQERNPITWMFDLYKIDLGTKEKFKVNLPSSTNAVPPIKWSNNGKYLAYVETQNGSFLHVYNKSQKNVTKSFPGINIYTDYTWLTDSTLVYFKGQKNLILTKVNINTGKAIDYDDFIGFEIFKGIQAQDKHLWLIARKKTEKYAQLYLFDVNSKHLAKMTSSEYHVNGFAINPNESGFLFSKDVNGVNKIYTYRSITNSISPIVLDPTYSLAQLTKIQNKIFATNISLTEPPGLVQLCQSSLESKTLYNPPFSKLIESRKPNFVEIKRENTPYKIPGYFWKADDNYKEKKTIIYIHGGPYHQSMPSWNIRAKILNTFGFNLLAINYHGSSGSAGGFPEPYDEKKPVSDIVASVDFLQEQYDIPSQNIILMGFSYGGSLVVKSMNRLNQIAGAILIAGKFDSDSKNIEINPSKKTKWLAFYGVWDPLNTPAYHFFEKNHLLKTENQNFNFYEGEGHILHRSSTWADIYAKIIESFST